MTGERKRGGEEMSDANLQEKLVARLRAFPKVDGNRVCADCTEKFPGQICLDFNTLVGA